MTSRRYVLAGAAALGLMALLPLPARADQEVVLGEKTVGFNEQRDVIQVGRREGRFTHLKLAVRDNPVFLERVLVHYANGDVSELPVRARIRRDSETRFIPLPGDHARAIRRIEIYYARAAQGDRARIIAIGRAGG
ncbi:DUF2541 family protein [Frigidibacter albus]|uniref:DUF2541 family protein n=1 Tax=Frigidibacter albus TaxID=1465486 RepID=A0A6L8VGF1_9RHOB|nr:DUF2541 family protein [Frigidibacter albus]MZQ88756.1 DUF2541 family protein [Frigidibacter albus]NBE30435.1 DUF2541 family protein [Frigidibacter albus]GGH50302.1 hypothetical protein GCM10011341_13180 [Frigidibacter albus]